MKGQGYYEATMDELDRVYGDVLKEMSFGTLCALLAAGLVGRVVQAS